MPPPMTQNSIVPIYCDDCGREKLAEVRDGKLVIADRRHGQRHVAVIPLTHLPSADTAPSR